MKIIILGAGRMAYGLVYDFLTFANSEQIKIIDQSQNALNEIKAFFNSSQIKTEKINADNISELRKQFEQAQGVISAVPYDYNIRLTELAIETGCHFVDLGGNNIVVEHQFRLNEQAKTKGVGIVPDCGLAPGMASVIAAYAMDQLARVDDVKIRVGGLPVSPQNPLKYKLVFSVHGLINEYIEPSVILQDGEIKSIPSMTGLETLEFPSPFGHVEAFYTSGGTSTLPLTYKDRVINLDYKTIRYPGHCHLMKAMLDLGFADKKRMLKINQSEISIRNLFETMLNETLQYESDDVVLIRISATGQKAGREETISYQAIEYGDPKNNLTAMMRTTAFPATIVLQMLLNGTIKDCGVLKQEQSIPGFEFIRELDKRRIFFKEI